MKIKTSVLALLVAASVQFAVGCSKKEALPEPQLDPDSTTIMGVGIGTKASELPKFLGKPVSIEESVSEVLSAPDQHIQFRGATVYVINNRIYNLSCSGSLCSTDRGARVGDSKDRIADIYKLPESMLRRERVVIWFKGLDSALTFSFKEGRVSAIGYFVNYV